MTEHPLPKVDVGSELRVVAFSADGKHLLSGGDGVRVWQVADGQPVATMEAGKVWCIAVSKDGQWIAAGTCSGDVCLWNAQTYKQVLKQKKDDRGVPGVDFSPDSTRVVSTSLNSTATVWILETCTQLRILCHEGPVSAAKYSPKGDRIATATYQGPIRIWDADDGNVLANIPVEVIPWYNRGLHWFDNHLFVISNKKISKIDLSTNVTVAEWPDLNTGEYSCIAIPAHGAFVTYSTNDAITFWDTLTHTQLGQIPHSGRIRSIVFSPDGQFLAIGGEKGTIVMQSLSCIAGTVPSSRLHPTLQEPAIQVDRAILDSWKRDELESAETLLTTAISAVQIPNHHVLACRSLVQARMQKWDVALVDAERAIKIQPSVTAYIAKSIAHVGNGDKHKAYRACDIAIERFHSSHVTFLLLIKAIIVFMAGEHVDAISRMDDLIATVQFNSMLHVVQAYMLLLHGNSLTENKNYEDAIHALERARAQLRQNVAQSLTLVSLISGWKFDDLEVMIGQRICEVLYSACRTDDANVSFLELLRTLDEEVYERGTIVNWVSDFAQRCLSALGRGDNVGSSATNTVMLDGNVAALLREWVKATLIGHSWRDALATTTFFITSRFTVYRAVCEHLEVIDRITDATECLLEMAKEMSLEADDEEVKGCIDLKDWCGRKLEGLGDLAMDARQHEKAVVYYSAVLSLNLSNLQTMFVKRSKAHAYAGSWKDALDDANQVIILDPSSPLGYERKHAALRVARSYDDAEVAYRTMLLKMSESADPEVRECCCRYVEPADIEAAIREAIQSVIRESPLVLINTDSGRLFDKLGQASSFESQPIFHELVCSTTTRLDYPRIEDEVGQYYRYATFSHKWKARELVYNDVIDIVLYELEASPTLDKLQNFCRIVREAGLRWAWSDTVCINKSDPSVLQEALVSMFQWYQSSTLTVVLLCDAPWKCLVESIWNTRAWTFQEYHASKVVRFYNKDWIPYRGIDAPNHKEAPEIIAEMEEATSISAQALTALQPGLEDIREKLRLASTRRATRVEDEAYSLLGIFSLSMPVVYGDGDRALGKLLAQLLTSSGDTSILAWTGRSGGFNSCLPARVSVFREPPTSHTPSAMTSAEMETIVPGLHKTLLNAASVTRFYDRLNELPVPLFNGKRMKLPSVVFKLGPLSDSQSGPERVFRAQTIALGSVEIKTKEDLSRYKSLALVHPWIDFLLDRQPVGSVVGMIPEEIPEESVDDHASPQSELSSLPGPTVAQAAPKRRKSTFSSRFGLPFGRRTATRPLDVVSLQAPSSMTERDKLTCALRCLARLRQPFGALLLASDPRNVAAYRRVAAGSLITVQVEEITQTVLNKLIASVCVLDVL